MNYDKKFEQYNGQVVRYNHRAVACNTRLPFRDEMTDYPSIVQILDAHFGVGDWHALSLPRLPNATVCAGTPIGGVRLIEIERRRIDAPGLFDRLLVAVILPTPGTLARLMIEPQKLDTLIPRCVVCGGKPASRYPARQKLRPDRGGWYRFYACREHRAEVGMAKIDETGHLHLIQKTGS